MMKHVILLIANMDERSDMRYFKLCIQGFYFTTIFGLVKRRKK